MSRVSRSSRLLLAAVLAGVSGSVMGEILPWTTG
jgi:hypothetical protein